MDNAKGKRADPAFYKERVKRRIAQRRATTQKPETDPLSQLRITPVRRPTASPTSFVMPAPPNPSLLNRFDRMYTPKRSETLSDTIANDSGYSSINGTSLSSTLSPAESVQSMDVNKSEVMVRLPDFSPIEAPQLSYVMDSVVMSPPLEDRTTGILGVYRRLQVLDPVISPLQSTPLVIGSSIGRQVDFFKDLTLKRNLPHIAATIMAYLQPADLGCVRRVSHCWRSTVDVDPHAKCRWRTWVQQRVQGKENITKEDWSLGRVVSSPPVSTPPGRYTNSTERRSLSEIQRCLLQSNTFGGCQDSPSLRELYDELCSILPSDATLCPCPICRSPCAIHPPTNTYTTCTKCQMQFCITCNEIQPTKEHRCNISMSGGSSGKKNRKKTLRRLLR